MMEYILPLDIRWSDLDPNFHMRHSVYYDYGAFSRVSFMEQAGLTTQLMHELHMGPILFREEAVFRKEIIQGDKLTIDIRLLKTKSNFSRWSIRHRLVKNKETLAAVITVDGAWLDTRARKLATPPAKVQEVFLQMPRTDDFEWVL